MSGRMAREMPGYVVPPADIDGRDTRGCTNRDAGERHSMLESPALAQLEFLLHAICRDAPDRFGEFRFRIVPVDTPELRPGGVAHHAGSLGGGSQKAGRATRRGHRSREVAGPEQSPDLVEVGQRRPALLRRHRLRRLFTAAAWLRLGTPSAAAGL